MSRSQADPERIEAGGQITREQLGRLGGDPHFHPPGPDRVTQAQHGIAPTTDRVAMLPWWWSW